MKKVLLSLLIMGFMVSSVMAATPIPTPSPDGYKTPTPTPEAYKTVTPTPTVVPPTATPTTTPSPSPDGYTTPTPSPTLTPVKTPTPYSTEFDAYYQGALTLDRYTVEHEKVILRADTPSPSPTAQETPSPAKTATPTPTITPAKSPSPTVTPTAAPTATAVKSPTPAKTPSVAPTATPAVLTILEITDFSTGSTAGQLASSYYFDIVTADGATIISRLFSNNGYFFDYEAFESAQPIRIDLKSSDETAALLGGEWVAFTFDHGTRYSTFTFHSDASDASFYLQSDGKMYEESTLTTQTGMDP